MRTVRRPVTALRHRRLDGNCRSVPALDADDAALQPRSRSWGLGDQLQGDVGMQPIITLEDIEVHADDCFLPPTGRPTQSFQHVWCEHRAS